MSESPRTSFSLRLLILHLSACSAVLDAPGSTFRDDSASPLPLAAVFEAPEPQRGARFGDKVVLNNSWLAVTSPFESAAGDSAIPPTLRQVLFRTGKE